MKLRSWWLGVLCIVGIGWGWWCHAAISTTLNPSNLPLLLANENSSQNLDRNSQKVDYNPNGEWIGRLILPSKQEVKESRLADWVWIEIKHAPATQQQLVGKTVRLTWQSKSIIAADVRQVTTDIKFTPGTIASQKQGNIHPQRLNGRDRVGALQSLAGARAEDDVLVRLTGVDLAIDSDPQQPIMEIDREPIQITGSLTGLVKILGTDPSRETACNAAITCPNEYFRVRHYDRSSQGFNGQIETIRIPQIPAKQSGLLPSTIRDLAKSPAGDLGWYIYGERLRGLFTVAAIQPRSLFTLTPQREIVDADEHLDYLNRQHWQNISAYKGNFSQVTFNRRTHQVGDLALAIHLFGGIGGKNGDDLGIWQTVTGHFAYGMGTVIRSTFTGELEWNVEYNQVYAHNSDGIIAGKQDWATYMGHLQRGWLATRPVADLLISYPPVTEDYNFGGIKISPLTELERQLQIAGARYRTGDGTGSASVTPATSCVQDANQALYVTIRQLNSQVRSQPQIQAWIAAHPQHPQTLRFRELQSLGTELASTLAPLGIVRQDWQQNAAKLAGIDAERGFTSNSDPISGLISWQTMLPRGAQDGIAKIFSRRGANIWFLNTFQVGGVHPDIFPIAPTILFGQVPILSTLVIRIWAGIITLPSLSGWLFTGGLLASYAIGSLIIGFRSGFLKFNLHRVSSTGFDESVRSIIHLFFMPALLEEFIFRQLLLPHPIETQTSSNIYLCLFISLVLFVLYHPFNARIFYKLGDPTFMDWRFLTLTGLLGAVCAIAYLTTGSIWSSVVIHWVVVSAWIEILGGKERLLGNRE